MTPIRIAGTLAAAALVAASAPAPAAASQQCSVVFSVGASGNLGALGWTVDYSAAPGAIAGSGNSPSCSKLVEGAGAAFTDFDAKKKLKAGIIADTGMTTPRELASCVFLADEVPVADDFAVVVDDAAGTDSQPVHPTPVVTVSSIDCEPAPTTTTTTTLPPLCQDWTATFHLDSSPAPLSGLQLRVDYSEANGRFVGNGADVECVELVEGLDFAAFDDPATERLDLGMVTLDGLTAPVALARCTLRTDGSAAPEPGDFALTVLEAAGVGADPATAVVSVTLDVAGEAVACSAECGDGRIDEGEECDDGNGSNGDACLNNCAPSECGDGKVRIGFEQCDDGNEVETDACHNDCTSAVCGDGTVRTGVEPCDDGNDSNSDDCLNNCRVAVCGDGQVHAGVEACDDGNFSDHDACLSGCVAARCGDGTVQWGVEGCDDANSSNEDACLNTCVNAYCGDGIVRADLEQCDDGNASTADGCVFCDLAACGDGFVRAGVEECDPAAPASGPCSGDCRRKGLCSDPTGDGRVSPADALRILQRAVNLDVDCPDWTCDGNNDGKVSVPDALLALQKAVSLPVALKCREPGWLVLRMTTPAPLGGLEVKVAYDDANAELVQDGPELECAGLVDNALFAFAKSGDRELTMTMASVLGVTSPRNIARCRIAPSGLVRPADFSVTIVEAVSPAAAPVAGVQVKAIPY